MKMRESLAEREYNEANYLDKINRTSLIDLSLDELASQYVQIDEQAHMMKGLILLEARSRFPSNKEFGEWVKSVVSICDNSHQVRNRLMNFARFFKDRDTSGIGLSICYLISEPKNQDIAENIYSEIVGKNLPLKEVHELILEKKGIKPNKETKQKKQEKYLNGILQYISAIHNIDEAIAVLQNAINFLQKKKEAKVKY